MLRPATPDDLDAMLEWRNQDVNREVSVQSHVITRAEHLAWWERVQEDPSRQVLMFVADGRALGVVSFFDLDLDAQEPTGSWGFYLDHETTSAEGIAMTAWMKVMSEATDHAFDVLGLEVLTGEVLEHNEAVRMMNRRFRFAEDAPETRDVDGRSVTVIPIRLDRRNRRNRKTS